MYNNGQWNDAPCNTVRRSVCEGISSFCPPPLPPPSLPPSPLPPPASPPAPVNPGLINVSAGIYPQEVSWTLSCTDGTSLTGGAPYNRSISVRVGAA